MGTKLRERDYKDCKKFYDWVEIRNPFSMEDGNLYSLSTGIASIHRKDQVDCGSRVQENLNGIKFFDAKIKRNDRFAALDSLSISNNKKDPIDVNPTLLFTRLAAIVEREEVVEQYFDVELALQPQLLFKNELMRKPDKSSLRNVLLTDETARSAAIISGKHVVDGGALLYRVHWQKGY